MAFENYETLDDPSIVRTPTGYNVNVPPVEVTAKRSDFIPQQTPYDGGAEAARAAAQGLTLGFGEELEAGLRAPFSDEDYAAIRDRLRAQQSQFGKDYPITQTALDVVGGLAAPAGILGATYKAGQGLVNIAKAGAGAGALTGAVTGAGVAPELSDIPMSAAGYGAAGGVLGGAAPVAFKLGGQAIGNIIDSIGFTNANKIATRKLQELLNKENLTPTQVNSMLDEYRRLGVPDPVLADIGENLRGAGYASYIVPNPQKTATADFLESRQQDLANNLIKGLEQKSGVNSQGRFGFDYINDLAMAQDAAAKKAYPQAYSKDIPATPFRKYADRDVFANAYEQAVKRADVYGQKLPSLEQIRNAQFISTQILHEIKKGLDDVVEKETDSLTGKMTGYGRDVANVKREFNDLIKYYNKDYAKANAKFADISKLKSSYNDGLDYMKMETSELSSKLKKMTPAERESFRVGMISDIKDKLSKFKGGDPSRLVFKSERQKESLKYAFDSEGQYKDFVRQVEAQNQLLRTYKKVRGGSETQERVMLTEDVGMIGDLAQGNIGSAAMNLVRRGAARAGGMRPDVAEIMQQRLFNPNPQEQSKILQMMQQGAPQTNILNNPATYGGLLGELQPLMMEQ